MVVGSSYTPRGWSFTNNFEINKTSFYDSIIEKIISNADTESSQIPVTVSIFMS